MRLDHLIEKLSILHDKHGDVRVKLVNIEGDFVNLYGIDADDKMVVLYDKETSEAFL